MNKERKWDKCLSHDLGSTVDVADIVTKITEQQDAFIIETIYPYSQSVAEMRITKEDLRFAITLLASFKNDKIVPVVDAEWIKRANNGTWECSACHGWDFRTRKYCADCGARMKNWLI